MKSQKEPRGRTDEEREYYSFSRRAYAIFAPIYDTVVFPFRKLRRQVASVIDLPPGSRLLDVATGTGQQAFAFAGKVREVVAIDLSEAMLRIARRKNRFPNASFQEADAAELPFEDGSFDASCISFALHEMPSTVRNRVVREMARVTKPGGSIIVVDYALPQGRMASAIAYHLIKLYERDHYATFVTADVAALLKSAGIEVSKQHPALAGFARIITGHVSEQVTEVHPAVTTGAAHTGSAPREVTS